MARLTRIAPCLWFDGQAEAAARYYTSVFENSRVVGMTRYSEAGREIHGQVPGTVMTVEFELDGLAFTALNGAPAFRFTEAVSFQVRCDTQSEIDRYWAKLADGGDPAAQQCGWLKDRFGLSWQVVPSMLLELLQKGEANRSERMMQALMPMRKLDIDALQRAWDGP
jgi:predicted 3-demethylubiquinone-9 3-methyltransferase (glyoxalase superfamily)